MKVVQLTDIFIDVTIRKTGYIVNDACVYYHTPTTYIIMLSTLKARLFLRLDDIVKEIKSFFREPINIIITIHPKDKQKS